MSAPRPLFLYTTGSLDTKNVRLVRAAGYQPIEVKAFDAVKLCEYVPAHALDLVSRAAMQTIAGSGGGSPTPDSFGRRVATALSAAPNSLSA